MKRQGSKNSIVAIGGIMALVVFCCKDNARFYDGLHIRYIRHSGVLRG
jgi:hypothetical protein